MLLYCIFRSQILYLTEIFFKVEWLINTLIYMLNKDVGGKRGDAWIFFQKKNLYIDLI